MKIDTTQRNTDLEIMDDLEMSGDILIDSLDQLGTINKWLGGNKLTLDGIKTLLKNQSKEQTIHIIDLGCGHGDILRKIAIFGRKNGWKFQLVGIDANQTTINYAIQLSTDYPEISFRKQDVLSTEFEDERYDIALCTLFLHHFEDEIALPFIQTLTKNATIGVVVNDLHRNKLAYYLFKIVTLNVKNQMIKSDGLMSILKAFKRKDLERFSSKLNYKTTIKWRWAFRFQWTIYKL